MLVFCSSPAESASCQEEVKSMHNTFHKSFDVRLSVATKILLCLTTVFVLSGIAPALAQPQRQFRAGAATSNITPWLGISSNGGMQDRVPRHVHDELHARVLVLDDGQTRLALVTVDSCMVPRQILDAAKQIVHQHTDLPIENMLMSATHTHTAGTATPLFQSEADAGYQLFLTRKIADAARIALNNMEPARVGWGVGQVPQHVFNRRWKMKPGTIPPGPFGGIDQVKMNPPAGSPDLVEPAGPTDPDLTVISVRALDGRPIALLANYSLHYVGAGHFSADYFGVFADRIQQLLGADRQDPPFVGMLSNGTSGNINNIDFRQKRPADPPFAKMKAVANEVAAEALRVCGNIRYQDWVPLAVRQSEIEFGVRRPTAEEQDRARQIMANAQGPTMRTLEEIYARETVLISEYPPKVPVILQALRIGDLGIAAIPCEVFTEIGLEIKRKSPFATTFTTSLANGYNGYLPTPEHHRLGGYETWRARSSYLEIDASPRIVEKLLGLLQELRKN
jgi:neutral ceramidase